MACPLSFPVIPVAPWRRSGNCARRPYPSWVRIRSRRSARALGLLLGTALDAAFGDARRWHPVAGFGSAATALERWDHRDSRWSGALHTSALVGGSVLVGAVAERAGRG